MSGVLRVAIPFSSAAFQVTKSNEGAVVVTGGYDAHFLDILLKKLGLKHILMVPSDGDWGTLKNGNWTGLVGMVYRGEADMTLGTLAITEDRLEAVDFSYPYTIKEVSYATKPPALLSRDIAFIMPFSKAIWIGVLLLLILLPIVFRILFSKRYQLQNWVVKVIGILLRQSISMDSGAASQKVMFLAWLFGASFLSMTYSSVLLSFLTVPLRESGIETKQQLARAVVGGSFKCATFIGSSFTERLMKSTDESTRIIGAYIKNNHWYVTSDRKSLSEYVYGGNTAAIIPRELVKMTFRDNHVFTSKQHFFNSYISVAFGKSFPYRKEVDTIIHEVTAAGIYEKEQEDFLFKRRLLIARTEHDDDDSPKQLLLTDLKASFYVLFLGLVLSFIVYILEVLFHKLC